MRQALGPPSPSPEPVPPQGCLSVTARPTAYVAVSHQGSQHVQSLIGAQSVLSARVLPVYTKHTRTHLPHVCAWVCASMPCQHSPSAVSG